MFLLIDERLASSNIWSSGALVGKISPWIGSNRLNDEENTDKLLEELSWAMHLGLKHVILPFHCIQNEYTNVIRGLSLHLSRVTFPQHIYIQLPCILPMSSENSYEMDDSYRLWCRLFECSGFNAFIGLILEVNESVCTDEEWLYRSLYGGQGREDQRQGHVESKDGQQDLLEQYIQRWCASTTIRMIAIKTSDFKRNEAGYPVLSKEMQRAVQGFMKFGVGVIVQGRNEEQEEAESSGEAERGGSMSIYLHYVLTVKTQILLQYIYVHTYT